MNENMIFYIVLAVIISVIINILFIKIKKLIDILSERERIANEPMPDTRPYHVPDVTQTRPSPPIPAASHGTNPGETSSQVGNTSSHSGRPPLPVRRNVPRRTPDTFPKCPRCGCKNHSGQMRLITWDSAENKWRCHKGHLFSS